MTNSLPAPRDGDPRTSGHSDNQGTRRRRRKAVPIPDVDDLLRMLLQLNSALLVGAMSPKMAATIRGNLQTVLNAQLNRERREPAGQSLESLVELCRRNPQVLDILESFLPDELFDAVMQDINDSGNDDPNTGGDRDEAV